MKNRLLIVTLCLMVFMVVGSCHTTKETVEASSIQAHFSASQDSTINIINGFDKLDSSARDENHALSDEHGTIKIERDSAGRPEVIYWQISNKFRADRLFQSQLDKNFFSVNETLQSNTHSGSDIQQEKVKDKTTTLGTPSALTVVIVVSIIIAVIIWVKK